MLDRISDAMFRMINLVPAMFVAEDSPSFWIARGMFAILILVLVALAVTGIQQVLTKRSPRH